MVVASPSAVWVAAENNGRCATPEPRLTPIVLLRKATECITLICRKDGILSELSKIALT